ncbi:MAG: FKBP-type peptidyl-prolyl cis-trans isomerase [Desulfobacterales bacterium]|nr:FKBP-type peptidyl-prolyl cis-trans isomerase [Desulfobacterales bacterium]
MKFVSILVIGMLVLAGQVYGADESALKSEKDKLSYTFGANFGKSLKQQEIEINTDIFIKGMKDGLSGGKTLLTDQEMKDTMTSFQKEMAAKQAEKRKALAEKNKKEGDAFLAANKGKDGIKTLPSGLQYKVITEGTGKTPKATDTVVTNYRGTLIDGTEFDSSYQRKAPATFKVNGVIKGWTEALQLMKEGAKWQLFVPSEIAYGERGAGPNIGPNAVLIFEIELISAKEESAAPSKPGYSRARSRDTKARYTGAKASTSEINQAQANRLWAERQ